jgi:hypothetical protein
MLIIGIGENKPMQLNKNLTTSSGASQQYSSRRISHDSDLNADAAMMLDWLALELIQKCLVNPSQELLCGNCTFMFRPSVETAVVVVVVAPPSFEIMFAGIELLR